MHEASIVASLIDIISQELENHGAEKLITATVKHGQLANIVPEAMQFGWEAMTKGTALEGAELLLEEVPLKVRCSGCGAHFTPEDANLILMPCPECGAEFGHEVIEGKELFLAHMEAV